MRHLRVRLAGDLRVAALRLYPGQQDHERPRLRVIVIERAVLDLDVGNGAGNRGAIGGDYRGPGSHGDFLGDIAEIELHRYAANLTGIQLHVLGDKCLESFQRGGQAIAAGPDVRNLEVPVGSRGQFAGDSVSRPIDERDLGIGQNGPGLVGNGSANRGKGDLSERANIKEHRYCQGPQNSFDGHFSPPLTGVFSA